MNDFNDGPVFSERLRRDAENLSGDGNHAGMFAQPVELARTNAYGFRIVTRHYSRGSLEYERTVPV